ncbi:MAG: 6-bladed beta-propeller [Candidatus Aminicenantes bacterium]|nr:6-bladed beta-propeller [Candidatus Aminicenantes bacterium]
MIEAKEEGRFIVGCKSIKFIAIISAIILIFPRVFLSAEDKVTLILKFQLDQTKQPLMRPGDIEVSGEKLFVTDRPSGNIKIYNKDGTLDSTFGRKGAGPGEFTSPNYIEIADGKICVQDMGQLKYIIFDENFNEITRFFFLMGADPFVIDDNRIINCEYLRREDDKEFVGAIIDFSGSKAKIIKELRPYPYSKDDSWNRILSMKHFIDIQQDKKYIYLVDENKVEIYKYNREGEFQKKFGKNPNYFRVAQRTSDYETYRKLGRAPEGIEAGRRWSRTFSRVTGLSALANGLSLAIENFDHNEQKWELYLSFYDFDGKLLEEGIKLKEVGSPLAEDERFLIDSNNKDCVYILECNEDIDPPQYTFYVYKINL